MFILSCLVWALQIHFVIGQDVVLPTVVETIETETKPSLGAAFLNCSVAFEEHAQYQVAWVRVRDNQQLSLRDQIVVQNKEDALGQLKYELLIKSGRSPAVPSAYGAQLTTYQLIIRQLQADDSGYYRCQIVIPSANPPYPHRDGLLIVQRAPQIVAAESSKWLDVVEGEDLEIRCGAEGIPTPNITWQRGSGEPFQNGLSRASGTTLQLTNVRREDRGVYRCYAQNNVGVAASYDAFLTVNYPPSVKPLREGGYYGQAPDRNYEVMLECVVSGYPDPDMFWYYTDMQNPLGDGTKYEVEKLISHGSAFLKWDDRIFTLTVRIVVTGDFGNYTCAAKNAYGSATTTVELFSLSTCQGAVCPLEGSTSGVARLYPLISCLLSLVLSIYWLC